MKHLTLILLFVCLFNISCSNSTENQSKRPQSPPILEMSKELVGLWDISGKVLEFRLYENGFAEFDFVDYSKKVSGKLNKTNDLTTTRQIQLSDSQMQKLLNLLTSDKFQNLKESYKPTLSCIDNFINNDIIFRNDSKEKKYK